MAKLSTDELLDAFKEMTLIELSEFVKQFEETFGVTAAAPAAEAEVADDNTAAAPAVDVTEETPAEAPVAEATADVAEGGDES